MKTVYTLTRVPSHLELQRAWLRLPRPARDRAAALVMQSHKIDLGAAMANVDAEALSASQRRVLAQAMHDRGAAFMLSALPQSA